MMGGSRFGQPSARFTYVEDQGWCSHVDREVPAAVVRIMKDDEKHIFGKLKSRSDNPDEDSVLVTPRDTTSDMKSRDHVERGRQARARGAIKLTSSSSPLAAIATAGPDGSDDVADDDTDVTPAATLSKIKMARSIDRVLPVWHSTKLSP